MYRGGSHESYSENEKNYPMAARVSVCAVGGCACCSGAANAVADVSSLSNIEEFSSSVLIPKPPKDGRVAELEGQL